MIHKTTNKQVWEAIKNALLKAQAVKERYTSMWCCVVAPVNNVVVLELKTAYDMLIETPLFRQSVKMYARQAMQRLEDYDKRMLLMMRKNLTGSREQYWLDYSDEYYDSLKEDLNNFYMAVLQELEKYDEPYRQVKARLITSNALLNHSITIYDGFFREMEKSQNVSLEPEFRKGRLSYVSEPWQKVVDSICVSRNPINMENEQIMTTFQVIEKRMVDSDLINASGKTALKLNPNVNIPNEKGI